MEQHLISNALLACLFLSGNYCCYSVQPQEPSTLHHGLLVFTHHLLLPYPVASMTIETSNSITAPQGARLLLQLW